MKNVVAKPRSYWDGVRGIVKACDDFDGEGGGGVLLSPPEFGFVLLTLCMGTTNTVSVLRLLLTLHRIYLSYCIPESRRESKTKNSPTTLFLFSGGGRWLYVLKLSLKYRYIHVFHK